MSAQALARQLADMERRLKALEQSTRLDHASVTDDAGNDVAVRDAVLAGQQASDMLASALVTYVGQAAADGLVDIYYDETTPATGNEGDLWLQEPVQHLYRFTSGAWVDYQDQGLAAALQAAQDTADAKVETFWTDTAPLTANEGDLWFDTSGGNQRWRWTDGAWQLVHVGLAQSDTYTAATGGWVLEPDGGVQFQSVSVVNEVGADSASFNSLTVQGNDIEAQFAAIPAGLIGQSIMQSGYNTNWIGSTETIVYTAAVTNLDSASAYLFLISAHFRPDSSPVNADLTVRYTVDGTTPTLSDRPLILKRMVFPTTAGQDFNYWHMYSPGAFRDVMKLAITLYATGGNVQIAGDLLDRPIEIAMIDIGATGSLGNGALAQVSKQPTVPDPTPTPDPTPLSTYTKTWSATWSRSYDGDGSTRAGDDTPDLYQGYVSSTHGRTRSLFGFDYASIMSALSSASSISRVQLTFKVKYRGWSNGLDVYVSQASYASKPSTWDGTIVDENVAHLDNCNQGSTYTLDLPTSVGSNFKSGATKCLGFGPGIDTGTSYFGYMYGYGSSYVPQLKITWKA